MKAAVLALTNISLMRFTFGVLLQDEIVGRYFEGDAEAAAANFIGGGMALMTELGDLLSSLPPSMINGTALVETSSRSSCKIPALATARQSLPTHGWRWWRWARPTSAILARACAKCDERGERGHEAQINIYVHQCDTQAGIIRINVMP